MSHKPPASKNSKKDKHNKGRTPPGNQISGEDNVAEYKGRGRLLFVVPMLAVLLIILYLVFVKDGDALVLAVDFFTRFISSSEKLLGELFNLVFGIVVLVIVGTAQFLDSLLPYLEKLISIVAGVKVSGTKSSQLETSSGFKNLVLILVYGVLSIGAVGIAFGT